MSRRIAHIRYDQSGKECVTNHATLEGLEGDVIERIRRAYGHEPQDVTYKARGGLWLDTGGMVMVDQPVMVCRLDGYSVRYKLEHAPYIAMALEERIADTGRRRVYGDQECVTFYMRYWIAVFPLKDARRVLRLAKRHAARGFEVGRVRRAELAACPDIHVEGITPGEA